MRVKALSFSDIEKGLFYILLLVFLYPVIFNKYFLTGDGPCHLYNSRVLLDFITSHDLDFYKNYYSLNHHPDPNWFSHVVLAFLLRLFPPFLAEKIFLTSYILSYAFSLRLLLKEINKENTFLAVTGILFAFHHTLQMGFYNYSFSFVFFFIGLRYWLKFGANFTPLRILILTLVNLLLYFVHPIGYVLSALCSGLIFGTEFLIGMVGKPGLRRAAMHKLAKDLVAFVLIYLPSAILMIMYLTNKGINAAPNPDAFDHLSNEIAHLTSLVTLTFEEPKWTTTLAITLMLALVYSVIVKLTRRDFNKHDGLFLAALCMLYGYFNQPGSIAGAGVLSIRTQFIPYLLFILWFANIRFAHLPKYLLLILSFTLGILLEASRIPHYRSASKAVEEYISVGDHIDDRSTVLPLSFNHNGKTVDGELIADHIWLFMHAADYLGTEKSLIMLGNYEANTGWFPIRWNPERNPFAHIATNGGIENQPPSVDLLSYPGKTGGSIDYVITWCLDNQYMEHPYTQDLLKQLEQAYDLTYVSTNNRARLYKLKSSGQ